MNSVTTHKMHLNSENFDEILNGSKKIEMRLYDEKRQKISVGDKILFHKSSDSSEILNVKVLGLFRYLALKELIDATPINYWGKKFHTKEQLLDAKWPYTTEEIKKYGLLAIEVELI